MAESGCASVCFSPQGKVLARHLNVPFVSELDGYRVTAIPAPPSKGRVYQSPGGQLWNVGMDGLDEFRGGGWVTHRIPEIEASPPASMVDPVPLYAIRQNLVLFLLPDKLVEFNGENPGSERTRVLRLASDTGLGKFSGMVPARGGGLWISGSNGLARVPGPLRNLRPDTQWLEYLLPASSALCNLQQLLDQSLPPVEMQTEVQTRIVALADSRTNISKVVVSFDGHRWTAGRPDEQKLRRAWRGPEQAWWAMAIDGLWQRPNEQAELTECDEISTRQYFDLALEPGGAFWLATLDGLFRYAPLLWQTEAPLRKVTSPIRCLAADQGKRLCFVSGSRLHVLQEGALRDYPLPAPGDRPCVARALFLVRSATLVLAAEDPESPTHDLLYQFQAAQGTFVPVPGQGRRLKALGLLKDGSLCVERMAAAGSSGSPVIESCDGQEFEPFADPVAIGLGAQFLCAFVAQSGDVWLASRTGTACLHDRKWRLFSSSDKSTPEGATCFAELADGKIWCALEDQVWEFDGKNWSLLRRGFDRINDMVRTKDGSMWVASNNGLLRFLRDAWVENGLEDGLPSTTVRGLFEDGRGLWAATSRGISLFHPEADPETDPPQTYIQKLNDIGNTAPEGTSVSMTYSGRDKWRYTARERLLYSYRIDDREWSPFQDATRVTFGDLSAGNHYFQVRSMDRNGNVDPKPAQLEFAIVLPWYKETRLVLIAVAGAAVALFFAGVAFNRHLRLVRSYAEIEKKVAERTAQLEVASQELFHSQKMNALGTLAAGIAHDFNNILSIIKGSAQVIEDNLGNPEKVRVRADRIKTVVEQGAGIVQAMLGFSRESGPMEVARDVNEVVQETLRLLGDRFLREVEVEFSSWTDLPPVAGSKDFIQQILLNFIFNAAEAMSTRKLIRLGTRFASHLPLELALTPAAATGFVIVSVQDFGCGIPRENLPRIFEPFFTTKALSARRGTGLGLSMVYELAKKLGAGLAVESVVDQGSTFMLILPVPEAKLNSTS
jgi:signal transduction histidine kinase/ligand-binding sensor domain-containing protein